MQRLFKRGRVWYCHVWENGVRRQLSTRCIDKKAAETVARQLERDAADPDAAIAKKACLRDALWLLLEHADELARAGRRAPETARGHHLRAGQLARILEQEGKVAFPLVELRAMHVDAYISQRRRERRSENTIHKELVSLRLALKLAKRKRLWRGEIDAVIPVGFAPEYEPRTRVLKHDELAGLLGQLTADQAARVAFIVATSACWRETELAQRGDVAGDFTRILIRGTKRRTRFRTVPIVTDDQRALLQYALEHAQGGKGMLFNGWGNVRHDLPAACKRAKIEHCSPNDLRRTCATWLREAGAPIDLIWPVLGHRDGRMVERVYGRLSTDALSNRLAAATGSLDVLFVRVALRDLTAIFCIVRAAKEGLGPMELTTLMRRETACFLEQSVPRDGIEPPTRGFSNAPRLWPIPRENEGNAGSFARGGGRRASRVHQKRSA